MAEDSKGAFGSRKGLKIAPHRKSSYKLARLKALGACNPGKQESSLLFDCNGAREDCDNFERKSATIIIKESGYLSRNKLKLLNHKRQMSQIKEKNKRWCLFIIGALFFIALFSLTSGYSTHLNKLEANKLAKNLQTINQHDNNKDTKPAISKSNNSTQIQQDVSMFKVNHPVTSSPSPSPLTKNSSKELVAFPSETQLATVNSSWLPIDSMVASDSKKKKMMKKKKKKMEEKHKKWKKGKKHKKKKYEMKKKKGGSMKKKKGKKMKKKYGMEQKKHKKAGKFKKKKWGKKKKMKKGKKSGKKGHKMLKDKGHKKKGFKKVYHKEEWGKKKKWHDVKREKKWSKKQKKWKKKWHQEKGKKYKGKHMKKFEKKAKKGKKYKKEKKEKYKKHKGEKFKKGHKKKKEEYSKKKAGGKKKMKKMMKKKMKKKKG